MPINNYYLDYAHSNIQAITSTQYYFVIPD